METAIMSTQAQLNIFNNKQKDQNYSDEEEVSSMPYPFSVKKSHSTPQSLDMKQNQFSDHKQLLKGNHNLQEIKEQEKTESYIDDQINSGNREESSNIPSHSGEKTELTKTSQTVTEEQKSDNPHLQHHQKSNTNSLYNMNDNKRNANDNKQLNNDQNNFSSQANNNNINIQRQEESKQLQTLYLETSEKNKLFEEKIRKNIKEFALDKYSHFIIILILENGSHGHKRIIIDNISKDKDLFSHEQFGHKVLNKCIEISKKEYPDLYSEFIKYIIDSNNKTYQSLQNDKFGNYVIQKCLEIFDDDHLKDLLFLLNTTLLIKPEQKLASLPQQASYKDSDLCSDQYGCLIIQKLIEIYKQKPEGKIKKQVGQMIEKVIYDSYRLAQKQFSNYVVQQIIEKGAAEHKNLLYQIVIQKQFLNLSLDKYGSNVAEKSVTHADQEQQKLIWNVISDNNFIALLNMVNDQYANYVVQRIFDISNPREQKQIFQQLNDWNKKNKLKENGRHPFKYIEDQIKQIDFNQYQNQRSNLNKQSFQNPINTQQQQNQFNRQQNNQNLHKNYKGQNREQNNQQFNNNNYQDNLNNNINLGQYNNSMQGSYYRNEQHNQQNNFYDQRNQGGQQNRYQQNKFNKNRHNNLNQNPQLNNQINKQQNQNPNDQQQQRGNMGNNRNQNQSQHNNQYNQNNNKNNNQTQGQNFQNNFDNIPHQGEQRNNQMDQNQNKQKRHAHQYGKGNYNHNNSYNPYNNYGYQMQLDYYQNPYYQNQSGYMAYGYLNQPVYYVDPSYMPIMDPSAMLLSPYANPTNQPILDFLNGAHLQLKNQKVNKPDEQQDQSQNTTTPNSLNSPQTQPIKKSNEDLNEKNVEEKEKNQISESSSQI